MGTTMNLELYIFNCIARFESVLKQYKEDALQEIRYAILVSETQIEALRMSNRNCKKMLRQFGNIPFSVRQRYEEHYIYHYKQTEYQSQFIINDL